MSEKEVKRICSQLSVKLSEWKLAIKEGKVILEQIRDKRYVDPRNCDDPDSSSKTFDEELNQKCSSLLTIIDRLSEIVNAIEAVHEKAVGFEQLCDLSSSRNNKSLNISSQNKSLSSSSSISNPKMIDLNSSVLLTSDLSNWTLEITSAYQTQLKMNKIVVQQICHLKSREECLFHLSIWASQPGLNTQCQLAECSIEQTLNSCSE